MRRVSNGILLLTVLLALAGCYGPDLDQITLCQRAVPWFEPTATTIELLPPKTEPGVDNLIIQPYRLIAPVPGDQQYELRCQFAKSRLFEPPELIAVSGDRSGDLTAYQIKLLRRVWLELYEPRNRWQSYSSERESAPMRPILYFAQQTTNAVTLGCIYALLAIGYTLVFGIIGRINLAFGELATVGAYIGYTLLLLWPTGSLTVILVTILAITAVSGALYGMLTERWVFRPLQDSTGQAPLIASLGLAIALQEALRLTQGSRERWLQPLFAHPYPLAGDDRFAVTVSSGQLLVMLLTLSVYGVLYRLLCHSEFGRHQRACADNHRLAALYGVDVSRTVALTFALGGSCAAIAGLVILLYYGTVSFYMGFIFGFKALVAAIIGGIGSLPGALVGGLLVGLLEVYWSGYLALAYKDVAIFMLLAVFLIFRPQGLFGLPPGRGD